LLTAPQVREIFQLLSDNRLTHAEIADLFAVSRPTISMINSGRVWQHLAPQGWKPAPPLSARGERNGQCKISAEEAKEVFRLAWSGYTLREVGDMFHISLSQVFLIRTRREWKHLWKGLAMTDQEDLKAEIDKLKTRQAELEAKLAEAGKPPEPFKSEPYQPIDWTARATMDRETKRELAKAIPDDLARDLRADALRPNPVTGTSQAQLSQHGNERVQIQRGSGWQEPNPLRPPAGVELCDRIMDAQDRQDRADLERRLARSVKTKE
jgi:hypothetical protein